MPVSIESLGIDQLSVKERLELMDQIWDSLPEAVAPDDVPEWHKDVLAKRLAEAEANPGGGVPWRTALAAIRSHPLF
jgi:putative addiction module component (TIGR02574 family)